MMKHKVTRTLLTLSVCAIMALSPLSAKAEGICIYRAGCTTDQLRAQLQKYCTDQMTQQCTPNDIAADYFSGCKLSPKVIVISPQNGICGQNKSPVKVESETAKPTQDKPADTDKPAEAATPAQNKPADTDKPAEAATPAQGKPAEAATPAQGKPAEADKPAEVATPAQSSKNDYVNRIVALVNQERAAQGLSPVALDETITKAAQTRANEIITSFSHTRPNGSSFSSVLREAGVSYRGCGENIAWGQRSPEEVMEGWMNSPGHRANILNANYKYIGVGHVQKGNTNYWSQLFTY